MKGADSALVDHTKSAIRQLRATVIQLRTLWLVFVLGLFALLLGLETSLSQGAGYAGFDFHAYEAAARVGQHWGWGQIYDQGLVRPVERHLNPHQSTLRFISPPPVAWLADVVTPLPYWVAYGVWAALMLSVLAFALAWSTTYTGGARFVAVALAIAPWWVLHALYVGQVVPLVAAGVVVAWRLMRAEHDVAAGIVLAVVVLKPQTAVVAPLAVLAAGRYRAFAAWVAVSAALAATSLLTLGPHGLAEYMTSLGHLPASSSDVTLGGALALKRGEVDVLGLLIVGAALVTAYRVRSSVGIAIAAGVLASLLSTPYLFENDLCLLGAAGWILWEELSTPFWRASLLTIWLLAATHLIASGVAPTLKQWPLVELALFLTLVAMAWSGAFDRSPAPSPTWFRGVRDLRNHARA